MTPARKSTLFQDHFSGHSASYADARPVYSDSLFQFLANLSPNHACAWDCATGNGQAAYSLANYFDRVVATDASEQQLRSARQHERIEYHLAPAEASGLSESSIDLITVAQAIHWFDIPAFFSEAQRVLVPGGVLAFWCYGLALVTPELDKLLRSIYLSVDDYWPPERDIVDNKYRDIQLPLPELKCPPISMSADWKVEQIVAYMRTWSASQAFMRELGEDPLAIFADDLRKRWGGAARTVTWPVTLKACRKPLA